jgi:hypothetical protein
MQEAPSTAHDLKIPEIDTSFDASKPGNSFAPLPGGGVAPELEDSLFMEVDLFRSEESPAPLAPRTFAPEDSEVETLTSVDPSLFDSEESGEVSRPNGGARS